MKSCYLQFDNIKQTNLTQMFNKKSTNTPLLMCNCASKNSLKTLFKVNAQTKRCICTLSIKHLGPIRLLQFFLLHDAKIRSSKGIFVTKWIQGSGPQWTFCSDNSSLNWIIKFRRKKNIFLNFILSNFSVRTL